VKESAEMAETDLPETEDSAEKAYAAAAEAIGETIAETDAPKPALEVESAEPVEFPAKPKRAPKPAAEPAVAIEVVAEPVAAVAKPAPKPRRAPAKAAKPAAKAAKSPKPAAKPAKPASKSAKLAVKRAAAKPRKPVIQKTKAAVKPAAVSSKIPFITQLKEIPMDMTTSVKDAFAKTSAAAGEYGEFAKGNVEAFVESGKILAAGLQELGKVFVADSKSVFETLTGEVKELSAVKSPTDFVKLQTELLRRNLDSAVAYGSKTSEAMLKLTNDVFAPISGRVSLAVEKVKKAA